ncbi:hypothetical protein O181_027486 [Austropuccinia psidii MF-1]|uniref:Uncharacterized protein n=1 Tax=Austropuccinia psidii MF-1 TaxID=1389203 RepID=A0A9Q3CMG1_9BASI|nr:hypothetical protein [Austropuccinia psidii MF-1]
MSPTLALLTRRRGWRCALILGADLSLESVAVSGCQLVCADLTSSLRAKERSLGGASDSLQPKHSSRIPHSLNFSSSSETSTPNGRSVVRSIFNTALATETPLGLASWASLFASFDLAVVRSISFIRPSNQEKPYLLPLSSRNIQRLRHALKFDSDDTKVHDLISAVPKSENSSYHFMKGMKKTPRTCLIPPPDWFKLVTDETNPEARRSSIDIQPDSKMYHGEKG